MKATHFLNEAIETQAQRAADHNYGEKGERTAAHVARIFNAITGRNLKERDIWAMLLALKLARNEAAPGSEDTLIDLVSYASLLAECDYAAEVKRLEDAEKENQLNTDRSQLRSLGDKLVADMAAQLVKPDSWLDWKGGNDPVAHWVKVDVKFRDGTTAENVSAGGVHWGNDGYGDDVIAFRVCPPVPKPHTAAPYQAQQDPEWTDWHGQRSGGPENLSGKVDILFRDGGVYRGVNISIVSWRHFPMSSSSDVIGYRPSK